LLHLVNEGLIDHVVVDSTQVALSRRFYPELRVGFDLEEPRPVAWAFPHNQDTSLYDAANEFLNEAKQSGMLEDLIERYYGHTERLNYVDRRTFQKHLLTRLPKYREMFEKAAEETGVDWQLLAAIGYQESHWNPKAVSPTGVRGIMMLTLDTADLMDIEDREDPWQSIIGGARYLLWLQKKIPERIPEPDRLWLALAGYNVGFGHLEDGRILTQRHGGDPDRWRDVKKNLPLLSRAKYYKTVKYGRARGREPVTYVDNIRAYYDMLNWHIKATEETQQEETDQYPLSIFPSSL
jgi:membrane-bound lytic murein transglycosylase F